MAKKKLEIHPHWRPDFRIPDTLPDIKVIRTDFIVNSLSVLLALLVAVYVIQREYGIYAVNSTISDMRQQVESSDSANRASLAMSAKFIKAAAEIQELEKFYKVPILAHHLITELARLKPDGLIFNAIKFDESLVKVGKNSSVIYQVDLSGLVRDPLNLEAFKAQISESEVLDVDGYEIEVREALMSRDTKTGIFPYRLSVVFNESKGKKGAAK